jgi:hypothetical protein
MSVNNPGVSVHLKAPDIDAFPFNFPNPALSEYISYQTLHEMSESTGFAPVDNIRSNTPTEEKWEQWQALWTFWRTMYMAPHSADYVGSDRSAAYLALMENLDPKKRVPFEKLWDEDRDVLSLPNHANYDRLLDEIYRLAARWAIESQQTIDNVFYNASEGQIATFKARWKKTKDVVKEETIAKNASSRAKAIGSRQGVNNCI